MRRFAFTLAVTGALGIALLQVQAQSPYQGQAGYAGQSPYQSQGQFGAASPYQSGTGQAPSAYQSGAAQSNPYAQPQGNAYAQPGAAQAGYQGYPSAQAGYPSAQTGYQQTQAYPQGVPQQMPLPSQQQPLGQPSGYTGATGYAGAGGACVGGACACGQNHGSSAYSPSYNQAYSNPGAPSPQQWASEQTGRWDQAHQQVWAQNQAATGQIPPYSVARRPGEVQQAAYYAGAKQPIPGNSIQGLQDPSLGERVEQKPTFMQRVKKALWPF